MNAARRRRKLDARAVDLNLGPGTVHGRAELTRSEFMDSLAAPGYKREKASRHPAQLFRK
ncbi:MAG: hypothetical protein JO069_09645 [Verrucomicrobia bacterium]|nr:hypothetical protein [Verrucomicrobiota bacterium]